LFLLDALGGSFLMTYHPMGGQSSSEWLHQEDGLDFNMLQSGHSRAQSIYARRAADGSYAYRYLPTSSKILPDGATHAF
jgi:hypothetical protein